MPRPLVIFHRNCVDGAVAAAIAYLRLGDDADYVSAKYQRPLEEAVTEERAREVEIYLVDFSFPEDDLVRLAGWAKSVLVFDHHKSALEGVRAAARRAGNLTAHLDLERCGASLAWAHFFPGELPSRFVALTEDYDLWRHRYPESRAVQACLFSWIGEDDPETVRCVRDCMLTGSKMVESGEAILRANLKQVRALARHPERVQIGEIEFLAVCAPVFQNDVCDLVAAGSPSGVVAAWGYADGRYKVSLRRRGDLQIDVSEIARKFGGGGHPGAAGFECARLPWGRRREVNEKGKGERT